MYNKGDIIVLINGEVVEIILVIGTMEGINYIIQGWDDLGEVYERTIKEKYIEKYIDSKIPF